MIIIKTKYLSATNTQGARIKASANRVSHTICYDYALDGVELHYSAVVALIKKHNLDWDVSTMAYGSDNVGYYFAFPQSTVTSK